MDRVLGEDPQRTDGEGEGDQVASAGHRLSGLHPPRAEPGQGPPGGHERQADHEGDAVGRVRMGGGLVGDGAVAVLVVLMVLVGRSGGGHGRLPQGIRYTTVKMMIQTMSTKCQYRPPISTPSCWPGS